MAFCSKIGNLVRQGVLKNGVSCGSVPMMHLRNSTCYMSTKLFIGGRNGFYAILEVLNYFMYALQCFV